MVKERADAQAIFLFDTSLSMRAAAAPGAPTRIDRARALAIRLERALPELPIGIADMTDRSLPLLLPTTDQELFDRTIHESVVDDQPPPSQPYAGRATTFDALIPLVESQFFGPGVQRRLLVVFTDGEATAPSPLLKLTLQRRVTPVYVHVWAPGERIFRHGRPDPHYVADPSSARALAELAQVTSGRTVGEHDFGAILGAARGAVGSAASETRVDAYARIALAPWFVLGCVVPLGFLFWRRNA
jgi:hypothetical protein